MMAQYRKKSIIVEAEQWFPGKHIDGVVAPYIRSMTQFVPYVQTPNGAVAIEPGEWIITGVRGEKYPCKPDIFEQTYEELEKSDEANSM